MMQIVGCLPKAWCGQHGTFVARGMHGVGRPFSCVKERASFGMMNANSRAISAGAVRYGCGVCVCNALLPNAPLHLAEDTT